MKTEPIYELTCVLRGSLKEADQKAAVEEVEQWLVKLKAKVEMVKKLGQLSLAYPIQGEIKGCYYYWEIQIAGSQIAELELYLQRSTVVIRYLMIKKTTKSN